MSRIEHEDWECPICKANGGWDPECLGLGTREGYYSVQELHAAAIKDENGIAAKALEHIEALPHDLLDRAFWVTRMIGGALRAVGAA